MKRTIISDLARKNGYWKEHFLLEDRLTAKGLTKVDRHITRNLCALLAIALCRL